MGVVIDKLLAKPLLHNHTDKVDVAGDTMTGNLNMGTNNIILRDTDGVNWALSVDTSGALITTQIITGAGTPFGLLLTITNSS